MVVAAVAVGPQLVLGAPGTGRTTALLSLAARRLREGLPADRLSR
jgi:KaiC/GvpD/RAD55 family RecA-like ATPase